VGFVGSSDVENHIAFVLSVLVYRCVYMVLRHVTHSSDNDNSSAASDADYKKADPEYSPRNIHVFN
jgi:hypothetical protein